MLHGAKAFVGDFRHVFLPGRVEKEGGSKRFFLLCLKELFKRLASGPAIVMYFGEQSIEKPTRKDASVDPFVRQVLAQAMQDGLVVQADEQKMRFHPFRMCIGGL